MKQSKDAGRFLSSDEASCIDGTILFGDRAYEVNSHPDLSKYM